MQTEKKNCKKWRLIEIKVLQQQERGEQARNISE